MKTKEEVLEKRTEIKKEINHLLYTKGEELDVKQSEWLCEIFGRKCLPEDAFTHSEIKLVKDTDWHTNYDIFFYNYDTLIEQRALYHSRAMNDDNEIDIYLNKTYPLPVEKPQKEIKIKKEPTNTQLTYLFTDGRLFKIGKSVNPEKRIKQLQTANPHIEMICYGAGVSEKYLHDLLFKDRVKLEWFDLTEEKVETIKRLLEKGEQGRKKCAKPIYETAVINEVKFNLGRKSGQYFKLSDSEKKRNADGRKRSEDLSSKYVIPFGKYKGVKMCDMAGEEQIKYCKWLYAEMQKNMSGNEKKKSRKYKAFSWFVRNAVNCE